MSDPNSICRYCDEPLLPEEVDIRNGPLHRECLVRMVAGSVAHQLRECSCYGGAGEDPPELTLREAAKLASETFKRLNRDTNAGR